MNRKIEIDVRTIYELAGMKVPGTPPSPEELIPLVCQQFAFLPQPIEVEFNGWKVTISHPQESPEAKAEAERLGLKAAKRASQGEYAKAIGIWKRAIELEPSNRTLRRDLAMAYVQAGDTEEAKDHLIEALRLDPQDVGSLVVLGNLYKSAHNDLASAERFIARAVTLKPDDPWALNSLAAIHMEQGRMAESIDLFSKVISTRPEFANSYLGMGMALHKEGRLNEATRIIEDLFVKGQAQDSRSTAVFNEARKMYHGLMEELAEMSVDVAFKSIEAMKRDMHSLSGYPVRVQEGVTPGKTAAMLQVAWKHGRDYHLVTQRGDYPRHMLIHLIAHEIGHLRLECLARKDNRNRIAISSPQDREKAIRSMAEDISRWQRQGYDESTITSVTLDLTSGILRQIMNTSTDMLIEKHLYEKHPELRPCQFLSLQVMAPRKPRMRSPTIRAVHYCPRSCGEYRRP